MLLFTDKADLMKMCDPDKDSKFRTNPNQTCKYGQYPQPYVNTGLENHSTYKYSAVKTSRYCIVFNEFVAKFIMNSQAGL